MRYSDEEVDKFLDDEIKTINKELKDKTKFRKNKNRDSMHHITIIELSEKGDSNVK